MKGLITIALVLFSSAILAEEERYKHHCSRDANKPSVVHVEKLSPGRVRKEFKRYFPKSGYVYVLTINDSAEGRKISPYFMASSGKGRNRFICYFQ